MLRMEFYELPDCMKMRMEGRFVRDFAEHARALIGDSNLPSKLIVDLSEVSFVDAVGEEVLLWFKEIGLTFVAESAYSRDVCERLQLPIETNGQVLNSDATELAGVPKDADRATTNRPTFHFKEKRTYEPPARKPDKETPDFKT